MFDLFEEMKSSNFSNKTIALSQFQMAWVWAP